MSIEQDYGVSITDYTLMAHLGGGGFGTVFLGLYHSLNEIRAVKVLHQLGHDPEQRFAREIRILQERSNEHCLQILDFGVTYNGLKYYAMDYCPLGNVRKLIRQVNVRFVTRLLIDICSALEPFHLRGGFHRDLKPDNILLFDGSNGLDFKLSDFGLAQDNNTSSVFTNNAAGTLGYIAPEIVSGGEYTPAADVYSLGVTARELLSGSTRIKPIFGEVGAVAVLIDRMTRIEPTQRPKIDQVYQRAIRELARLDEPKTKAASQQ